MSEADVIAAPPSRKALAVILGARAWPNMNGALVPSDAFALSSSGFKSYLRDNEGLNLPDGCIKDLFDSDLSKDAIDEEIAKFLQAHYKDDAPDFDTLIIYYTGHADFTKGEQHFYLTLRSTSYRNVDYSSYQMGQLAATVNQFARVARKIVILDCCYAAGAFVDWQRQGVGDVDTAIVRQAQTQFAVPAQDSPSSTQSGTALLCACNEDKWALYQDGKPTMFSGGLVRALRTGDRERGEMLSIDDVLQLTQRCIIEENKASAVKPWLRIAKGSENALKTAPMFPNPALRLAHSGERGMPNPVAPKHRSFVFDTPDNPVPRCSELTVGVGQGSRIESFYLLPELRFGRTEFDVDGAQVSYGVTEATLQAELMGCWIAAGTRLGDSKETHPDISAHGDNIWIIRGPKEEGVLMRRALGDEALCLIDAEENNVPRVGLTLSCRPRDLKYDIVDESGGQISATEARILAIFFNKCLNASNGTVTLSRAALTVGGSNGTD